MTAADRVVVRGLRLWAHVGVLEHERRMGQWFELDFSLGCSMAAAAAADDLSQTLDYSRAIQAHDGGAYLEVMVPGEESQPLPEGLIERLHQTHTPHA